jgi:hypothetical protein
MRQLMSLVLFSAIVAAACAGGSDPNDSAPDPSADDDLIVASPSDLRPSRPAKSSSPAGQSVTGVLGFDEIEGGCWFLGTGDGTRYEVVYPDGWSLDRSSGELSGPDGQVVRAGESLTVRGFVATDRASICQIGPIFVATDVEIRPS